MTKLLCAAVLLVMAVGCMANIEDIPLTPARCQRAHKNTPTADIDQRELCSICDQIVENRYKWPSWNSHYNALTYNFPHHLMPWVNFQACSLSKCSDFVAGSCRVSKTGAATSDDTDIVTLTPCPAKYICFTCLSELFKSQVPGCFDRAFG